MKVRERRESIKLNTEGSEASFIRSDTQSYIITLQSRPINANNLDT